MMSKSISALFAVIILLVGASGCTSNESRSNDFDTAEDARETYPLDEFLGNLWGIGLSEDARQRRLEEQDILREEIIAQCMNDVGFTYELDLGNWTLNAGDPLLWQPEDIEWVSQWGYGAILAPGNPPGITLTMDLDIDYLADLSENEQLAWQWALYGDPDDYGNNPGCRRQADTHLQESDPSTYLRYEIEFAPLFDALGHFQQGLLAEISEADRDWVNCMAENGFPGFERQSDAQESVWDKNGALQRIIYEPELSLPNEIIVLQEYEVTIALADLNCREKTDFRARVDAIRVDEERRFIEDHRQELNALRDVVEQHRNSY